MHNRSSKMIAVLLVSFALTGAATAEIIEMEVNDLLSSANLIDRTNPIFSDVGVITLGLPVADIGDVDIFKIDLLAADLLLANTTGIAGNPIGSDPDTILALVDPAGTIIAFDDDDAQGFGSNFTVEIPNDGTYFIATSGFGDTSSSDPVGQTFGVTSFIGAHNETGPYILTVSVVPEPVTAAFACLGIMGIGLLVRRHGGV